MYALISVSNKEGLEPFARAIAAAGYTLLSTGGTARKLREAGLDVVDVHEVTGSPEIMDGRVKTLHPRIHGGLLGRRDVASHVEAMREHGVADIRLVVVNLYPFVERAAGGGLSLEESVELVDIGGPTMLRASAKNHAHVTVVTDPADYPRVGEALAQGGVPVALRRELALAAFRHTAAYDAAIVGYLERAFELEDEVGPVRIDASHRVASLRYGENPHQRAALYRGAGEPAYGGLEPLHGKALSYNNIVDLDAALALVDELSAPGAAIIKHTNPAGCASHDTLLGAYGRALACDSKSAFGGIVALNRSVDLALAERLADHFYEVIAAPGFDEDAFAVLTRKKNVRLLRTPADLMRPRVVVRQTLLGGLAQEVDPLIDAQDEAWEVATTRAPTEEEAAALAFAWRVCKHVKSNAIVLARDRATVGIGAGQMSRVDAVELAVKKAVSGTQGAVLASDAFFPFRDGPDAAAAAGVTAIIQPGGSRRDPEVVAACDEHGIAMIFTGHRHFRH